MSIQLMSASDIDSAAAALSDAYSEVTVVPPRAAQRITVADEWPNTIVEVTPNRALVETRTGQNFVSLRPLQDLADRAFAGER